MKSVGMIHWILYVEIENYNAKIRFLILQKARNTNSSVYKEFSRDPVRTPMQWDDTQFAGFCESCTKPWLPVNFNFQKINVKSQQGDPKSTLQLYKNLIKLRKEKIVLQKGGIMTASLGNDDSVFAFKRTMSDQPTIAVLINLSDTQRRVSILDLLHPDDVTSRTRATVLISNNNAKIENGAVISDLHNVHIDAYDAVVFEISSASKLFKSSTFMLVILIKLLC
jgi:glycosidase